MGSYEVSIVYGKLSNPIVFEDDFEKSIDSAYLYFCDNIYNSEKRPTLFSKKIFIEAREKINERPSGFWHIVSLEERHRFNKVLPCNNDSSINCCNQNCNKKTNVVTIKYGTECRSICLYRASRIHWIIEIISLANISDSDVKVWKKPGTSKESDKLYLRYNNDGADFVIVFSVEKRFYRLISAFPVFYLSEKETFDKEYLLYKWEYLK